MRARDRVKERRGEKENSAAQRCERLPFDTRRSMLSRWKHCATLHQHTLELIRKSDLANEISAAFVVDAGKTPGEPFDRGAASNSLPIELFDSDGFLQFLQSTYRSRS